MIIEVAHPSITVEHGASFLAIADYMVGSPTVFADAAVEASIRAAAATPNGNGLYIPSGALWGVSGGRHLEQLCVFVSHNCAVLSRSRVRDDLRPRRCTVHVTVDGTASI